MTRNRLILALAAAALVHAGTARAGTSDWAHFEGGSVRVVTAAAPDEDGSLAAALDIRLKPGWKTYWRDPGDAGVPPQIGFSAGNGDLPAQMAFPAPKRFSDGYATWAGYDDDIAFPITITLGSEPLPATIRAELFMGICENICIPAQASLEIRTAANDGAEIAAAAAARLPKPETGTFRARLSAIDGERMIVEAVSPGGSGEAELFVAGSGGHMFGEPKLVARSGRDLRFEIPVLSSPGGDPSRAGPFPYTLVTGAGAVSGELRPATP